MPVRPNRPGPSLRLAVPMNQFCERNSVSPRNPPCRLKVPNTTASQAPVQPLSEDGSGRVSRMLIGSICLDRLIGCRLLPAVDRSCAGEHQGEKNER